MRTFQAAATLLTPYQQKKKDEAAEQTEAEATEAKPKPVVPAESKEAATETAVEAIPAGDSETPSENDSNASSGVATTPNSDSATDVVASAEVNDATPTAEPADTSREEAKTPAASATKPAKSEPKNMLTNEEERLHEEQRLLNAIFSVENERLSLEKEVGTMTGILRDLQEQLNEANQTRRMLLEELPESLIQIRSGETADAIVAKTKEDAKEAMKPIVLQWHQRPLKEIATGIEGLGPAKLIKLCEACPTIGDANNERIAAQQMKQHFADRLPRGIGKRIANQLETRIIDAETNHDIPPAAEQVKQNGNQDGTTETRETVTPGRDPHVRLVTSIARSLRATATRETLFFDEDEDAQEGFVAFEAGTPETDCPKFNDEGDDSNQRITQWLKGWLLNELIQSEQAEPESEPDTQTDPEPEAAAESEPEVESLVVDAVVEPESEPASEPEADSSSVQESDTEAHSLAVQNLAEQIKAAGDFGQARANENWALGYEVAIDELPVEACPSGMSEEDASQWIKGWLNADSFGGGL